MLEASVSFLKEGTNKIRMLSHSLVEDVSTNDFNFKNEILNFQERIGKIPHLELKFIFEQIEEILDPQLQINIFRIIQELVNNIIKHSSATTGNVTLARKKNKVILIVTDNGIGFNTNNSFRQGWGIGLRNIRDRVSCHNGILDIQSTPNSGTSIIITIPVE